MINTVIPAALFYIIIGIWFLIRHAMIARGLYFWYSHGHNIAIDIARSVVAVIAIFSKKSRSGSESCRFLRSAIAMIAYRYRDHEDDGKEYAVV
jgi:hypothetical protein